MIVLDDWQLTPARVAIHLPTRTAVAADLHLGYDRIRQRGGEAVPSRPLRQVLADLADFLARKETRRLVIAGDLFEDPRHRREELLAELTVWLNETNLHLVGVIPGNHDRKLAGSALPLAPDGIDLGDWRVVHGDRDRPAGKVVQGHEHPWMRVRRGVEGPCYLVSDGHLVLPAWSADAAGVNVLGQGKWARYRLCVIAGEEVLDFGTVGNRSRDS